MEVRIADRVRRFLDAVEQVPRRSQPDGVVDLVDHLRRLPAVPALHRRELEDVGHVLERGESRARVDATLKGSISLTVQTESVFRGPSVWLRSA